MGAYIISVDVTTEATTGQEICPGVVIGNNSDEAVAVALSWADESQPGEVISGDTYANMTILGAKGSGYHEQEKLYPSVRAMPSGDVVWGVAIWRINEDGITWTKVEPRYFTIRNTSSSGGGGEEEGGDEGEQPWYKKYKNWLIGGTVAAAGLVAVGLGISASRKK